MPISPQVPLCKREVFPDRSCPGDEGRGAFSHVIIRLPFNKAVTLSLIENSHNSW
jgi:hypothetical protein